MLNDLGIKENDRMIIDKRDQDIVLSKPKHITIKERIEKYNGEEYQSKEFFLSDDVEGNEIW